MTAAVKFDQLKAAYPRADRRALFQSLGGEWPSLIDDPSYTNTCAIRLSVALKACGVTIPPRFREAMQGDGSPLVIKVATMSKLVTEIFGQQTWGMSKPRGVALEASALPNIKGIIAYHVQWVDATGHFDLWTGSGFVGSGNFDAVKDGFAIGIWRVD